jgi:CRISPR-associated endoribonuclease Cas6
MNNAKVFELKVKVFLLQNIELKNLQICLSEFIDKVFQDDEHWLEYHNINQYKSYVVSGLYPVEGSHIYKKENIYTIIIRTTRYELADYFQEKLSHMYTGFIKGLTCEVRILPKKFLAEIYTLTPVIMKNDTGYWRGNLKITDFEKGLKENLIKKYKARYNVAIDENYPIYLHLEFTNKFPISTNYKNIKLLGDKVCLKVSDNEVAQELAYFALGEGLLSMNARGFGFVNYRWL